VEAVGEDAGGDEDEQDAGVAEELREVDLHGAAVDEPAEHDGAAQADHPADEGLVVALAGGLGRGVEEDRGLEALAADAEEGDEGDREGAHVEGLVELALELARDGARRRLHPEDHEGDEDDRDDRGAAADELLGLEGQLLRAVGEQGAEGDREGDGDADAGPHVAQCPASVGLDEEGDEDDDHEGGLESLSESDERVAREHWRGPLSGNSQELRHVGMTEIRKAQVSLA
jgi:hypothetical protein